MKNKILNIKKQIIYKKNNKLEEKKKIILKSIIQNKNIKPIIRSKSINKITKLKRKSYISKQKNNICLINGRIKGVWSKIELSRHVIKKMCLNGELQSIKNRSW